MIKAFLVSFALIIVFSMVYVTDLFVFLSGKTALLLALLMVVTMLVIARIILGNPYVKDKQDDENEE
ncbi:MAG: hypothetical protein E7017_03590 [Alphaproteobacteria bacterium]|nr:hypothetical protein [Alphaproteobacteria bacterium]